MEKIIVLVAILSLTLGVRAQSVSSGQDYILTTTFGVTGGGSPRYDVEYYDNLGYPIQRISIGASPDGKSIVTPVYYDALRRENQHYLPYVSSVTTGVYVAPATAISNQKNYYNSEYSGNSGYSYAEDVYEASPLDRVTQRWNVGNVYRTNSKKTTFSYGTNTATEVEKFTTSRSANGLTHSGKHAAGTLSSITETDEDGSVTVTFKDMEGRVVLERRTGNSSQSSADTYYVYDEVGNLSYVLPPELIDNLGSTTSIPDSNTNMARYAYIYKYNTDRNLCIEKRLPGAGWVYMVYDKRDRMVLSQDAVMRAQNKWQLLKYDAFDRPVEMRIIVNINSRATLQSWFNNSSTTNINSLYASGSVVSKTQYDNHTGVHDSLDFVAVTGVATTSSVYTNSKGLKTYEWVAVLDGSAISGSSVERAFYYDYRGRVIQTVEKNRMGGVSRYSTEYDFVGNVLASHESHESALNAQPDVKLTECTYDHRGRLLSETTALNGGTPAVVTYGYDELGRLTTTTFGTGTGAVTETSDYNIQGWLTERSSPLFDMTLRYHNPVKSTSSPSYTGNIAEWVWTHKGTGADNTANTYSFAYDYLSRLTDSRRYTGTSTTPTNAFSERNLTYDKNGNILTLKRYGTSATTAVDDLTDATYNGNQLSSIKNNGTTHTYDYDSNGNMTTDGLNALQLEYNFLNLTGEVSDSSGDPLATYTWLADGTKVGVIDDGGHGLEYTGSLIYRRNGTSLALESAAFGGGRIEVSEGTSGNIYTPNYFLTDHLGSTRAVVTPNGTVRERNDYHPFGLRWSNANTQVSDNRYLYNGKELQTVGMPTGVNLLDYGWRMGDSRLGRWPTQDRKREKYYPISPYAFTLNNPIRFTDPDGRMVADHIDVEKNQNGTYTVVGGVANSDKNIYVVDKQGNRTGEVVGEMLTEYSFHDDDGNAVVGTVINPNDNSGQGFFNNEIKDIGLFEYMRNAQGGEPLDFKTRDMPDGLTIQGRTQYSYRGMPFEGKVASGRDVGNYAAGYVAGKSGFGWGASRFAFDALETKQVKGTWNTIFLYPFNRVREGLPTQKAQRIGHNAGYSIFKQR